MNIFDQILSVENFIAFKKLMVKKNKELYIEAYKILEAQGQIKIPEQNKKVEDPKESKNEIKEKEKADEIKKELDETLKLEKEQKILNIQTKKLDFEQDNVSDTDLEQIKRDLGPLNELKPLKPLNTSKKNQIDEIRMIIEQKKKMGLQEEKKVKDDEVNKQQQIKQRENYFNNLRDQIKSKKNEEIENEYVEHVKNNGNKLEQIPSV